MADDPLRELLGSPLDDGKSVTRDEHIEYERPSLGAGLGPWLVAAVVVGALAVLLGYRLASPAEQAATTIPVTTSTTADTTAAAAVFPDGYTPVDDHLAMRVERILVRSDATFVTISSVTSAAALPGESSGILGGRWDLVFLDGSKVTSTEEGSDAATQGFRTIRFGIGGIEPGDIASLELTGTAVRMSEVIALETGSAQIPDEGTAELTIEPGVFPLDAGVDLQLSNVMIGTHLATFEWKLMGNDEDAIARVFPTATITDEQGGVEIPRTRTDSSQFRFFLSISGLHPMGRSGEAIFESNDPGGFDMTGSVSASIEMEVTWSVFIPTRVTIPTGKAAIAVVDG